MEHLPNCTNPGFDKQTFFNLSVIYCENCGCYNIIYEDCEHENKKILIEYSNGSTHIRDFCIKCHRLGSVSYKKISYPINKMTKRTLKQYEDYIEEKNDEVRPKLNELKERLNLISSGLIRKNFRATKKEEHTRYIQSYEWRKKRETILIRDKYLCKICGLGATEVHHINYDHLGNEYDWELISICRSCHEKIYKNIL